MKLEYNDKKIGCIDWLILLIGVLTILLSAFLTIDCYTQPTIGEAPGYCMALYK